MITDLAQRRVSMAQWKSIGARNPKVWRSILHGDSECFLCSTLETRQKTSFSISLPSSKLTTSLILFTLQSCMQLAHSPRKTTSVFSRMFPEQKQIMQTTCSSLIQFSSVIFLPIRRFKKQKPVKEVEPLTCYWSKFNCLIFSFNVILISILCNGFKTAFLLYHVNGAYLSYVLFRHTKSQAAQAPAVR